MENECLYFESYNFREPTIRDGCLAFSIDGTISEEAEAKIFEQTRGIFGKPMSAERRKEE